MLADDDKDDCYFFEKALKEIPIKTSIQLVNNGEELMEYLNKNPLQLPDVLFLDLSMPRKNGFECLTEIKESDTLHTLPVIMFSTSYTKDLNYEEEIIQTLSNIGAEDYIRKPDNFEQLKLAIKEALNKIITKNHLPNEA